MRQGWQEVRLGDALVPVPNSRAEKVKPTETYRLLGVRLDGAGAFLRETKLGAESSAPTLYRVRTGDFIYSRLFAWRGAFSIIPEALDGCYVSNEFPLFNARENVIDLRFLYYWFRSKEVLDRVEADCTGSTPLTRNRYKESFFLNLTLFLPPLEEQRRIVARVEGLLAKVEETRGLREETRQEVVVLSKAARNIIFMNLAEIHPIKRFDEIADIQLGKMLSEKSKTGVNTKPYLRNANIQWGRVDLSSVYTMDFDEDDQIKFRLSQGDILVCEGGNIGQAAIWMGEIEECYYQKALHRIRLDESNCDVHYVFEHLIWNAQQDQYDDLKKQSTIAHLPLRQLKAHPMITPPLPAQEMAVRELSRINLIYNQLEQLQAQSQLELDALPSSILARAFAGEL